MPRQLFVFDPPERFVAGTVGQPGERTFYLQARQDDRLVTLKLEKQQVAALAELLGELLSDRGEHGPLPDASSMANKSCFLATIAPLR